MNNGRVFVTGTDTGVGKTLVSACLVRRWGAAYWKPVQTGLDTDVADSVTVAELGAPVSVFPPRYEFGRPLSPEAASGDVAIGLDDFSLPAHEGALVVEGAGGVLVPIGGGAFMADLMGRLGLPIVLVARTALGTINHTLLSLEALRSRGLQVLGVVLSGAPDTGNRNAIALHGRVRILAELPLLPSPPSAANVAQAAASFPAIADCAA